MSVSALGVLATVCLLGITMSQPDTFDCSLSVCMDCPSIRVDERGEAVYQTVKWAIESSPIQLTPDELRQRMAVSHSDGPFACGESGRHTPMQTWNQFVAANTPVPMAKLGRLP